MQDFAQLLGLTVDACEDESVILSGKVCEYAARAKVITLRGCMFRADTLQSAHSWPVNTLSLNDRLPSCGLAALASFSCVERLKLQHLDTIPIDQLRASMGVMARLREISITSPRTNEWACFDLCCALSDAKGLECVHLELGKVDKMTHGRCIGALASMLLVEIFLRFDNVY